MTDTFLEEVEGLRARANGLLCVNDAPPARLYQYTDAAGLIGILSARSVWATDARFLNDSSEASFVREVIAHAAASTDAKATHTRELVAKLVQLQPWEIFMGNLYVASFSTKRDLLSQWRAYGGDGVGYAMGVDSSIKLAPAENPDWYPKVSHYSKVVYDVNAPGGILWEMVAGMLRILDHVDESSGAARADLVFGTILDVARSVYPTLKNAGFAEEDEWRLIFENHAAGGYLEPLRFRPNGRGFSPYVALRWEEPPVVEVVLGPRVPVAEGEHAVSMLLLANEHSAGMGLLKAEITRSTVSYRR